MMRPSAPPEMDFFAEQRPAAGECALGIDLAGLSLRIEGLDAALASLLENRFVPYTSNTTDRDTLVVRLGLEPREYFIDPPQQPEFNPVLLRHHDGQLRYLGYRLAGWFDLHTKRGEILLASGGYEPVERAIENYVRVAVAWVANQRGGGLVHAASAVHHGKGYLFFGESGAGKSTLSECNRRARVVSDDLSLILPGAGERPELVGSPFRGTYTGGEPVVGRFPLTAGFRIVQSAPSEAARVEEVSRAKALAGLVANLPFVADALSGRSEALAALERAFAGVPLAHLHFRKDDTYWDAIEAAGY